MAELNIVDLSKLEDRIIRLRACVADIENGKAFFAGSEIDIPQADLDNRKIMVNTEFAAIETEVAALTAYNV